MKCTMIINPNSGRGNVRLNKQRIEEIFLKYDYQVDIIYTDYKGHALKIVEDVDTDLLISVGGDGTFSEVMTGNLKRTNRLVLSHIPLGTANDIGAMYGYTRSFYKNLELLLTGAIKNIDICTINGKPFTYAAAFGKFTNISYDTPGNLKRRFGYLAYLVETLKDLKRPTILHDVDYEVNGISYQGKFSFMLISNANHIGGINNFYSDVKLNDNQFEVLFCELTDYASVAKNIALVNGNVAKAKGFRFYKAQSLKIDFKHNLSKGWSLDGEELSDKGSVFDIQIVRDIQILIPKKNIKKLFLVEE